MSFTVTKGGVALTVKLEYSSSDLSVGSPTYTDVSSDLIEIEWWAGRSDELGEPSPGGMTVLLRNLSNRWTPGVGAVDTERRFRLTLTDPVGASQQGVWYTEGFEPVYPASDERSLMKITCVDGFGLLQGDHLAAFDPPEASSYADVIGFDQPWGFWRLGEQDGARASAVVRKGRTRRARRGTRYTLAPAESVSGPPGVYKNFPQLAQQGLVAGDPDTCAHFTRTLDQYVRVPVDDTDAFTGNNKATAEAWVNLDTTGNIMVCVAAPGKNFPGFIPAIRVQIDNAGKAACVVAMTDGSTVTATSNATLSAGTTYHVAGTWDGGSATVYINGVADGSVSGTGLRMLTPDSGSNATLFGQEDASKAPLNTLNGYGDDPALYDRSLPASRILAHYQAGAQRGFAQELTGTRIVNALTSSLWSEAKIQTGKFQMQPRFYIGASKLEAVLEAVGCESPRVHFYFDGAGDPVFRDFDYDDGLALSGTFGQGDDAGTLPYADVTPLFDNAAWNTIRGSRDGGTLLTATDSARVTSNGSRVRDDEVSLPLASDADVDTVLHAILDGWSKATQSFTECMIYAVDAGRISHALRREPGDRVAVVKSPWKREVPILGYRKTLTSDGVLTVRWNLGRGVDALEDTWLLGVPGRDELGTTTVLG